MPRKKVVEKTVADEVGVDVKSTFRVRRVPVDSTRVVALDLTPSELRGLLAGAKTHDAARFAGALVWMRCRVPEGEAAPSIEDVRAYLKAAGARSARVDVAEVVVRKEKGESEMAKRSSARERMGLYLDGVSAPPAVRAEVERVMDTEDVR